MRTPAPVYQNLSLIASACSPAIPNRQGAGCWSAGDPFINVAASLGHWSATSNATIPYYAWFVRLSNGSVSSNSKALDKRVVAVRGGP